MTKAKPNSSSRWRVALAGSILSVGTLLTGCSVGENHIPFHSSNPSDMPTVRDAVDVEVRAYVQRALTLIEENAILIREIDWEQIRVETLNRTADATSVEDTYDHISYALSQAGGPHSSFLTPEEVAVRSDPQSRTSYLTPPTAETLGEGIVILDVPPFSAPQGAHAEEYVEAGTTAIRTYSVAASCGWIVDLRQNTGGNMWPMIAALTPLLPDGPIMSFVDREGQETPVTVSRNSVSLGGTQISNANPQVQKELQQPVAVLQSGRTGSSGEAILISLLARDKVRTFGTNTFGFTTGNITEELSDGALLMVTNTKMATADGTIFEGHIQPIKVVQGSPVETASNWLRNAC